MALTTKNNFHYKNQRSFQAYQDGDDFYAALINMHRDLSEAQSAKVNAKLILLLSNHIGDIDVLKEAMDAARQGIDPIAKGSD